MYARNHKKTEKAPTSWGKEAQWYSDHLEQK
jgi:hypothetical protein